MSWKSGNSGPVGSIALRLAAWYALLCLVVIAPALGLLDWLLARGLEQDDDELLADRVRIVRALLAGGGGLQEAKEEIQIESLSLREETIYIRVVGTGGEVLAETPRMSDVIPRELFIGVATPDGSSVRARDVQSTAGRVFRVAARQTADGVIQVGMDRHRDRQLLVRYRMQSWSVAAVVLVVFSLIGYRVARRGLRPVEDIAEDARRVTSSSLHERIKLTQLPRELMGLGVTLNQMLDHIEEGFNRLAEFSADIAHELRTPVSNLRGTLEVALNQQRSVGEYQDTLGSCLEDCGRIARTIDGLLFLARSETPETRILREPVDVNRELQSLRDFYEPLSVDAGVTLLLDSPENLHANLDRMLFQRALGNLIENALPHTPSGGTITIRAGRDGRVLRVEVCDTGSGIAAEHLGRVFERFYRAEPSRSTRWGGTGLGLAIVKQIAVLHGGQVAIESAVGQGTRVTLIFPEVRIDPHDSMTS